MSNDFLSRWSRRKREAESTSARSTSARDAASIPLTSGDVSPLIDPEGEADAEAVALLPGDEGNPATAQPAAIPGDITPEELAALPTPDEMTAASDITGFLRQGVPAALRNRALRRMWSIDPSIRDSIGDARDYAWDWNTPGGVPASGPLSSTMDVKKMLRDIFGTDRKEPDETRVAAASAGDAASVEAGTVEDECAAEAMPADASNPSLERDDGVGAPEMGPGSDPEQEEYSAVPHPPAPRRHGGALPS